MAATALTHPQTPMRRGYYRWYCPTCKRWVMRDGKQGSRHLDSACSNACYRRKHLMQAARNIEKFAVSPPFEGAPAGYPGYAEWSPV